MRLWLVACLALIPSILSAQVGDLYTLRVYAAGAASSVQVLPLTGIACGLDPSAATNTTNPNSAEWNDPGVTGKVCRWLDASSILLSLPSGNYEGTLTRQTAGGVSAESSRAPFTILTTPDAPTGLRFFR